MIERRSVFGGGTITLKNKRIIEISDGVRTVCLLDQVVSTGAYFDIGLSGTVIGIEEPHVNGRTSDVVSILWQGSKFPVRAKFHEFQDAPRFVV